MSDVTTEVNLLALALKMLRLRDDYLQVTRPSAKAASRARLNGALDAASALGLAMTPDHALNNLIAADAINRNKHGAPPMIKVTGSNDEYRAWWAACALVMCELMEWEA